VQSTLTGVAQAVVDKIVRIHHDVYMSGSTSLDGHSTVAGRRDDITFLVRNFNFPLPNALNSPTNAVVRFNPIVTTVSTPSWSAGDDNSTIENSLTVPTASNTTDDTSTTESSSDIFPGRPNPLDKNRRIEAYVDFSDFFQNVEKARAEGLLPLDIEF
jgi:TAK1-binding protein 1